MELADVLIDPAEPARFPEHILRFRNERAADEIGLDGLSEEQWTRHFAAFDPLPDTLKTPQAMRYHGHQFRVYNPEIGDGRGFTCAQGVDAAGRLMDLGTKGSGTTRWSRSGDGRLTLKGAVRELLATEMLEALGVETSRTFSIVETGEELMRGDEPSPTRSAVLVRLCHGHVRIGSFQRLAYEQDARGLETLVRYSLEHLYREDHAPLEAEAAAHRLFALAVPRVARLGASYMAAGFVHGVLNTDNINITGESFDYGPWRFAPRWSPRFTAAYFDHNGLYSFGRQAEALQWNLAQLAIALRPIAGAQPMIDALEGFGAAFRDAFVERFLWRLGVRAASPADALALVVAGETYLARGGGDIDRFFFDHAAGRVPEGGESGDERTAFEAALAKAEPMRALADDYWSGDAPQAMLIGEVEAIWSGIADDDYWMPLYEKVEAVRALGALMQQKSARGA